MIGAVGLDDGEIGHGVLDVGRAGLRALVEKADLGDACPRNSAKAAPATYWTIISPDSKPEFSAKNAGN